MLLCETCHPIVVPRPGPVQTYCGKPQGLFAEGRWGKAQIIEDIRGIAVAKGTIVSKVLHATAFMAMALSVFAANAQAPITLKEAYQRAFVIGAAINSAQFTGQDARGAFLIKTQFSSITPENALKWANIHPRPDAYAFDLADKYVAFGEENHMLIVGHCLVWHNQIPRDVFRDEHGDLVKRRVLLKRMRDHIHAVVGRYKGRITSWDVVNEALNEDGTLRQSLWMKIIGEDYISKAFQYAHEADPRAQLTYNDYSLENEAKRKGAVALIRKLQAKGVPITSVGLQGHDSLTWPSVEQQEATILAFADLGLKVFISELDIDVLPPATAQGSGDITTEIQANAALNPYVNGLPDSVQQESARRYADLFEVFLKHPGLVSRVTLWGVTDADSWRNNWPVRGRTNYPLLFDRQGEPKPAFHAVILAARGQH
jgi:endo-1,4-beta-xylanase